MDDRVTVTRDWFKDYRFHLVDTVDKLSKLVDICIQRKLYSIDYESTGLDTKVYGDEFFGDGIVTRHGMRTVDRVVGVCISPDGQNGYYVPLSHEPDDSGNLPWDEAWDELERLICSSSVAIYHNSKFDHELGYPVTGREYWGHDEYEDTFLMYRVHMPLKSSPAGLKHLAKVYFGVDMVELDELFTAERRDQLKREKRQYNFGMLHPREGLEYGCGDGIFTYKLYHALKDKLDVNDQQIYSLEKTFCNVLRKMERNRVHIDVDRVHQLQVECKSAIDETGDAIRSIIEDKTGKTGRWLTLKVSSTKELSQAFFNDQEGLQLKPTKEMIEAENAAGQADALASEDEGDEYSETDGDKTYSLKDDMLKSLHRDYGDKLSVTRSGHTKPESIFELILEWRHYDKMRGSFIEKLALSHDKYGDVRPNFNQMGTDTARLSATAGKIDQGYSGINFQGIPRDSDEDKPELFKQIRTCIIPREGWVLAKLDFSAEELRVVTNMSGDKVWTKSFLYEDGDVHSITSRILFGKDHVNKDERNRGKRSNFAFIYGGGAGAIQRNVDGCGGVKCSIEDAQRHMDNLRKGVPELMGYIDHQKAFARKYKCIYTAFGRRIPIPTIDHPIRTIRSKAERCSINFTIQATSADLVKTAMCFVDKNIRKLGWEDRVRYILTVHDEVVYEIKPEYLQEVVRKLDEWMVAPWKLPKKHGREWVVPLLTDPGIDTSWKASYDYFKMVDGIKALPKDINEDGSYNGKLKKDEFYENGRVYQQIPDFLSKYLMRLAAPAAPLALPEAPSNPVPSESIKEIQMAPEVTESQPEPVISGPEPLKSMSSVEPILTQPEIDFDSISLTDIEIDTPATPTPTPTPTPQTSKFKDLKAPRLESTGPVHRWTFRATPSAFTQKKLLALITLCDGDVPLRIMSQDGSVMVGEDEGIKVNPAEWDVVSKLFGL